jgi:phosphatidylglycerol lysyltransferase
MSAEPEQIKLVATLQRWKPWLIGGAVLIITALLVHTLRGLLHAFSYGDLLDAIRATSGTAMGFALLATLISYLSLTG